MLRDFKEEFQTEEGAKGRSKAKSTLAEEAQAAYKIQDYSNSLVKFTKYIAAVLLDKSPDAEVEASLYANIGSCLHHLGEVDLGKVWVAVARAVHAEISNGPTHRTCSRVYPRPAQARSLTLTLMYMVCAEVLRKSA